MNPFNTLDEIHPQVLKAIEVQSELTQRKLAKELGVSFGKAHCCIKALIDKGLVKMGNFSHSQKKLEYAMLKSELERDQKYPKRLELGEANKREVEAVQ